MFSRFCEQWIELIVYNQLYMWLYIKGDWICIQLFLDSSSDVAQPLKGTDISSQSESLVQIKLKTQFLCTDNKT